MKLISESNKIEIQDLVLFEKLGIIENYKLIMPENVSKFEIISSESFMFSLKGMPAIKSVESKINFTLTASIVSLDSETCSFQLEFNGDLNPMIQMMVKTPLQTFINDLSNNVTKII